MVRMHGVGGMDTDSCHFPPFLLFFEYMPLGCTGGLQGVTLCLV